MQGVICPSCGTVSPSTIDECPQCGTSLGATKERTHVKARYSEPQLGRTMDGTLDDEPAYASDANLPFVSEKRTAPHAAHTPPRRASSPGVSTVSDSTIPFRGGGSHTGDYATKDTGPELASLAETIVPPDSYPPTLPPAAPAPPPSQPNRRPQLRPAQAPTERAPAVRLDSITPMVLEKPATLPAETQPGAQGPNQKKDALIGTQLGEYVVEERVGIGGMGIVYRAVQPLIGNSVAIKVLRPDVITDENDLQRFLGEARTVNSIRHRSIISIFGAADTPDGRKYLVMEYLEGESLEARLQREGRISTADAIPILEDVLSALAAAHSANVVHRDLKPANVFLVNQSDGRPWVKLLDFGLARGANKVEVSRIAGTPDYISPEHARGKAAGPPSDLYAFGVLAFHLLTGKLPFVGNTPMEVMEQHVHKPPPVPHEIDDTIPLAMSHLILRLLDKEPANRPDAKTVKADLKAAAKELRQATTHVGPRPQNPNQSGATVLHAPPIKVEDLPAPQPDPRLARRAIEADRARGGWLSRNWPWLAGGVALVWLMTVALYLLTRPGVKPDQEMKPIQPPKELLTPPPDTTGAEGAAAEDHAPAKNPAEAEPLPPEVDDPPADQPALAKPASTGEPPPAKKPKKNARGK